MNSISALITERTRQSSLLKETVNAAVYRSVDSFMRAFDKSHALVEEYLKIKDTDANKSSSSKPMQEKKQSVLEKIQKYDQEAKRSKSFSKRRKTVPKKGMEIE